VYALPSSRLRSTDILFELDSILSHPIYHHGTVSTDVAIHLQLEPGTSDRRLTELGLRLANALKAYGMVEHNTWLEA